MALLPTLGAHILEGMDVEGVTQELQSYSRASKSRIELQHPTAPSESSAASSTENVRAAESDVRSDNGSVSVVSSMEGVPTELSASSTSWVDKFSQDSSQILSPSAEGRISASSTSSPRVDLSDSVFSTSSFSSSSAQGPSASSVRLLAN